MEHAQAASGFKVERSEIPQGWGSKFKVQSLLVPDLG